MKTTSIGSRRGGYIICCRSPRVFTSRRYLWSLTANVGVRIHRSDKQKMLLFGSPKSSLLHYRRVLKLIIVHSKVFERMLPRRPLQRVVLARTQEFFACYRLPTIPHVRDSRASVQGGTGDNAISCPCFSVQRGNERSSVRDVFRVAYSGNVFFKNLSSSCKNFIWRCTKQ